MDKDLTMDFTPPLDVLDVRDLLTGAIDGYDETSRFSLDKIEISALSLYRQMKEICHVTQEEYREALNAGLAVAIIYRSGLIANAAITHMVYFTKKEKEVIDGSYKPVIEATICRALLRNHEDVREAVEQMVAPETLRFLRLQANDRVRKEATEYMVAVIHALDAKDEEELLGMDASAQIALEYAKPLVVGGK